MSILLLLRNGGGGIDATQYHGDDPELGIFFDEQPEPLHLKEVYQQLDVQPQIEDAWDWSQDDAYDATDNDAWTGVEDQSGLTQPGDTQYFGDDAETIIFSQEDDDYAVSENYSSDGVLQYFGEDAEQQFFVTDDDDYFVDDAYPSDCVLQYYGEDAELLDQDDDDQVIIDSQPQLPGDAPIEDGWDWWSQEDDDYVVIDDYAIIENLNPVEDAWDHFTTDDDDQVDVVEFQLVSAVVTTLQYYGEDAELADLDQDDDEWAFRDEANVQIATLAQVFDDGWDFWSQDEDDYVVIDDYALIENLNPVEDAWDHFTTDEDDYSVSEDFQNDVSICVADGWDHWQTDDDDYFVSEDFQNDVSICVEDAWDHFNTDDDDQVSVEETPQAAILNPLLCVEDAWDWFVTDDDDYTVSEDFNPTAGFIVVSIFGIAIVGCTANGFVGNIRVIRTIPPWVQDSTQAWLGYRGASGGRIL